MDVDIFKVDLDKCIESLSEDLSQIRRNPLVIVLDGILDTFNIGSFFRLADAVAAEKIILCGPTVTPPNIKIHRASVGTWKWVPWEQQRSAIPAILKLKKEGYQTIAIEQTKKSTPYHLVKYPKKLALVLGYSFRVASCCVVQARAKSGTAGAGGAGPWRRPNPTPHRSGHR